MAFHKMSFAFDSRFAETQNHKYIIQRTCTHAHLEIDRNLKGKRRKTAGARLISHL